MFEGKLMEAIKLLLEYNPIIIYLFRSASINELREDSDSDISKASTVFKAQIVGNGKVIYCSNDKERMFFEMRSFKEYVLFNDERKCIIEKHLEDFKELIYYMNKLI